MGRNPGRFWEEVEDWGISNESNHNHMEIKNLVSGFLERCRNAYSKSFLCKKAKSRHLVTAMALNILLSYAVLTICQIIFILANWNRYESALASCNIFMLIKGFLAFATPSVCYINSIYLLLLLFPLHYKEGKVMRCINRYAFVIPNVLGVIANLCDSIYIRYTDRRTTYDVFNEFSNDANIGKIIGIEMLHNWWLVILGIIIIVAIYKLYTPTAKAISRQLPQRVNNYSKITKYYIGHIAALLVVIPLLIIGIRGGISKSVRPITLSNANVYVTAPNETVLVLNTPFTIIRTIGRKPFSSKEYFTNEELEGIYTSVTQFKGNTPNRKNIVIIIVESFGKEYIGIYNPRKGGSLTPFLDSLIKRSKSYLYSYGNGKKSIDGMPSILSSIPMFVTPFISSSASLNDVSSIAGELDRFGYNSAFFHGAPNGSMGFSAYAKTSGFDRYHGMTEYNQSPNHNGEDDFDGTWAIWDEPFLQYYGECLTEMREPFVTSVFTASSHHPFNIPDEYKKKFPEGSDPFFKCVRYTDYALQQFFSYAEKQAWYDNTLFVITADHTNHSIESRYQTPSGEMEVPVIFFSPQGEAPFEPGIDSTMIAQQIDIMPTVLEYVGYDKPFIAFGKSLISTPAENSYAVNYANEAYRYYKGDYILLYDGDNDKPLSLFNLHDDILMKHNILNNNDVQEDMIRELQAIIQEYMNRMVENRLIMEN